MNLYLLKAKCITFFCCLLFAQTVLFAQSNVKITIKKNEITLREALTEVEKQSKIVSQLLSMLLVMLFHFS